MPTNTPIKDSEVTVTQQGLLHIENGTMGFTGTGTINKVVTVPNGKRWQLIAIETYSAPFVGTITSNYKQVSPLDEGNFTLNNAGSTVADVQKVGEQNITLNSGDKVRISINCSAYTSGDIGYNLLLIESDS